MTESLFMPLMRDGVDPIPELGRRRKQEPISRLDLFGTTVWLVTRHRDVRQVLGDADGFSSDFARLAGVAGEDVGEPDLADPGGLGFRDPPEHTRLRGMLAPAFTPRRLQALAPRIQSVITECLDAIEQAGPPADLVENFATQVPARVIGEMLGVPRADQEQFARFSANRFDLLQSMLAPLDSAQDSLDYLMTLIARERSQPGEGLLGTLVREHGAQVTDRELAGLADGLLVGGHETTASMLALGVLVLLHDSRRADQLREHDELIEGAVEELLRHLTVVQVAFPRIARRDAIVGGQQVSAGDLVLCSLSSANRDRALGAGLDHLDLTRPPVGHLAFSYGIHHCLGAQLARMELRVAFPALLRRFPHLRLAVPPEQLRFTDLSIVYGLHSLPVTW